MKESFKFTLEKNGTLTYSYHNNLCKFLFPLILLRGLFFGIIAYPYWMIKDAVGGLDE